MRQPIKNSSRVPRYQNLKIIGGFCDYFFKPLARSAMPLATNGTQERLARGLESGSRSLLRSTSRRVSLATNGTQEGQEGMRDVGDKVSNPAAPLLPICALELRSLATAGTQVTAKRLLPQGRK